MGGKTVQGSRVWALAGRQHGVVARRQLLALGLSTRAIEHRLATGRLHRLWGGVYAVGRPDVSVHGHLMGAVLACGACAVVSHSSAAWLWGLGVAMAKVHISVPAGRSPRRAGIEVHRRSVLGAEDVMRCHRIPVTGPVRTLVDIATHLHPDLLERAVNEADRLDLTKPEELRRAVEGMNRQPGSTALRRLLDRRTFTLTDSELERRFLALVRKAGMPGPETQRDVNGVKVDFYWPELGLVVETDGLRYHRTPAQQTKDRIRDQLHTAAGLVHLRFTHAQVTLEPEHVRSTLMTVARRLRGR
jgi:very-short-patch-repair endonuclease